MHMAVLQHSEDAGNGSAQLPEGQPNERMIRNHEVQHLILSTQNAELPDREGRWVYHPWMPRVSNASLRDQPHSFAADNLHSLTHHPQSILQSSPFLPPRESIFTLDPANFERERPMSTFNQDGAQRRSVWETGRREYSMSAPPAVGFEFGDDPRLIHHLDGLDIIRHSHTPFSTSGGFCDVFTGDHPYYGKVAMKRPRIVNDGCTMGQVKNFRREAVIWKSLQHPHILRFLGVVQSDGHLWLISIFAANGALPQYLQSHPEIDRSVFITQLSDAIRYLHRQQVVHGDIKGSNVLVSVAAEILLCDFGLAKLSGTVTTSSSGRGGSLRWTAPELLFEEEVTRNFAGDVYAFGMTIYEILSGNVPFSQVASDVLVIKAIERGSRPSFESIVMRSEDSYALLPDMAQACWAEDPSERPSMDIVCDRLRVPRAPELSVAVVERPTLRERSDDPSTSTLSSPPSNFSRPSSVSLYTTEQAPAILSRDAGTDAPTRSVDVEAILSGLAAKANQPLNWKQSIVDLMKLLGLDSSLSSRKKLAKELHYNGDVEASGPASGAMNIWLHKQIVKKLAENGGKVPDELESYQQR